jgi:hypothetical protein
MAEDTLIHLLEEERKKFNNNYKPTSTQLNRLKASVRLLKKDYKASEQKYSTQARHKTIQENLKRISMLSSSIFVLLCLCKPLIQIGKIHYLTLIPKFRTWWGNIECPTELTEFTRAFCETEEIEYAETSR